MEKKKVSKEQAILKLASFCAYQERAPQEVIQRMARMELTPSEQQEILAFLRREKYLDEHRFALAYVRGKLRLNGWGRNKIAWGLQQKGIPKALAEEALREIEPENYSDQIRELAEKKLKTLKNDEKWQQKNKIFRYLASKGFEPSAILNALDDLIG